MRDTSDGMIEIIKVFEESDGYYSIIEIHIHSEKERLRFGVTQNSYKALRKILQSCPLDAMPGLIYRYFVDGSMGRKTENNIFIGIRCEVEGNGKSFDFEVPQELASNLKWFAELKSFDEVAHLRT